jgi:hypothetical protein
MIIYKITNNINDKVYIGQTIKSLTIRKSAHRRSSHNKKLNPKSIHYFMSQVGFDNFKFEVVKECDSKNELDLFERFYISEYKSNNPEFGYNLTSGGTSNYEPSEDYRRYMSSISKCKMKIDVYNNNGLFFMTYPSINCAARELNISPKKINRVLKNKRRSSNGFIFRYNVGSPNLKIHISEPYSNKRKIAQFDLIGNKLEEFSSIKEASEKLLIDRDQIQRVLCKKRKKTHGFYFDYL